MRENLGVSGHGLYSPLTPRLATLVSMPAPEMFLPISSMTRMSRSKGIFAIQVLTSARFSSSRCSICSTGSGSSFAVLWYASSRMARPPIILPELSTLRHAADHVFQAHAAIGVRVIALRAGELAEPDGHHLVEAALD